MLTRISIENYFKLKKEEGQNLLKTYGKLKKQLIENLLSL